MISPIIEKVEKFIQRIHDCELVITEHADKVTFKEEKTGNSKGIGALLAETIFACETANKKQRLVKATECLIWINRAYYYPFVKENGEALLKRISEKETQIQELQLENAKLTEEAEKSATDLVFIQGKYDEISEKFNKMVPKGDETYHV